MKAKLRSQWLHAMRSREYLKCRGVLREERTDEHGDISYAYCALGLLQEVSGGRHSPHQNMISTSLLSIEEQIAVMGANDRISTWPAIADWVQKNIPSDELTYSLGSA